MNGLRVGFALCGSFCTFEKAIALMMSLVGQGAQVTPILSFNAAELDTRFGTAASFRQRIETIAGRPAIDTIQGAEPIGPKGLLDVLLVAPCTGNTLAKLAAGITDTPVTMAVKSHLRGERPVVLAVSTNDGLASAAKNIGTLLERRHYYFVPFAQDDAFAKPRSLVADLSLAGDTITLALQGKQLNPILKI